MGQAEERGGGKRPTDPRRRRSGQVLPHRARRDAQLPPDRPRACPGTEVQRQQLPYPPHRKPHCRHPVPPSIAMAALDGGQVIADPRDNRFPPVAPLGAVGGTIRRVGGLRQNSQSRASSIRSCRDSLSRNPGRIMGPVESDSGSLARGRGRILIEPGYSLIACCPPNRE